MMDSLWQDVRFAWRGLVRAPGFAAIAVATLALGIGANSAIFTVVNAVVMRPLPYTEPDRLARVTSDFTGLGSTDVGLSQPELADYRDRSGIFEALAGVWALNANLTEVDEPERVEVLLASPSYFDVLGARPQLGRLFRPDDEGPGITEVLVISDALWRRRFASSPSAIGRRLKIDQDWYTVIGVLPPEFRHPGRSVLTDVDAWAPASFIGKPFPEQAQRFNYFITGAIGRLKPGITVNEARQRLAVVAQGFRDAYPNIYPARAAWAPRLLPLQEDVVGPVRSTLLMLFGAVGLVLLIACVNIANLLMVRASSRERELAVRRALGASRGRLARLLLVESLMLATLGGAAGAVVTGWLLALLLAIVPSGLPRLAEIHVDANVVAFTGAASLLTALMFGALPALQSSRIEVNRALNGGMRGGTVGKGWMRSTLVVVEVAMAVVLLVGATLLVRSFWRVQRVELGFEPARVLTAKLWLPQPNDPDQGRYSHRTTGHQARLATYEEILRRAAALPGVTAAAAAESLPLDGTRSSVVFTAEGTEGEDQSRVPTAQYTSASARYFEVMGIRLLRGRTFGDQDDGKAAPAIVVTESIARRSWPGQDPIGKRLHLGGPQAKNPWLTVVGVVDEMRTRRIEEEPRPTIYRPLTQRSGLALSLALKTQSDSARLRQPLAAAVRAVDPDLPAFGIRPLAELVAAATASRRFSTQLLTSFAGLALALAAIGIYGVMAFVVGQRTREIGIRIALGARSSEVVRMVLGQALALAAVGLAAGLAAAALVTRLLVGLLFEVRPTDPITYTLIAGLLSATVAFAAWRPARRAAMVDPTTALRGD
jgi:putative ABC transport system permease protein